MAKWCHINRRGSYFLRHSVVITNCRHYTKSTAYFPPLTSNNGLANVLSAVVSLKYEWIGRKHHKCAVFPRASLVHQPCRRRLHHRYVCALSCAAMSAVEMFNQYRRRGAEVIMSLWCALVARYCKIFADLRHSALARRTHTHTHTPSHALNYCSLAGSLQTWPASPTAALCIAFCQSVSPSVNYLPDSVCCNKYVSK